MNEKSIQILETIKPYGIFRKVLTTRYEVWIDGVQRGTFAGEYHLEEAKSAAMRYAEMARNGASDVELNNFIADFGAQGL